MIARGGGGGGGGDMKFLKNYLLTYLSNFNEERLGIEKSKSFLYVLKKNMNP